MRSRLHRAHQTLSTRRLQTNSIKVPMVVRHGPKPLVRTCLVQILQTRWWSIPTTLQSFTSGTFSTSTKRLTAETHGVLLLRHRRASDPFSPLSSILQHYRPCMSAQTAACTRVRTAAALGVLQTISGSAEPQTFMHLQLTPRRRRQSTPVLLVVASSSRQTVVGHGTL